MSPERLRQLMANDVELSNIVFTALIARRELLQRSTAAQAVEIAGTDRSAAALALRTYAARQRLIHLWFDAGTPAGRAMMESSGLTEDDLPAVVLPGASLKQATPGGLADKLGLSYRRSYAAGLGTVSLCPLPTYLLQAGDAQQPQLPDLDKLDQRLMYGQILALAQTIGTLDALPAFASSSIEPRKRWKPRRKSP